MTINSAHNPGEVDLILGKSRAGERLSKADGLKLLASDDIIALGAAAHAVKRRRNSEKVYRTVLGNRFLSSS